MPGALQSPISENVAERHRKMLVGADITERGDLTVESHETNRIAA
jgi:hypothetical protein